MTEQLTRKRVVVAMSGGVDSSTTAALLKAQGHDVIGISMQLWDRSKLPATEGRQFGTCCSLDDVYDARRIAEQIGIPFYVMNFEEEFERLVIKDFVDEYFRGRTPNPCIRCNQWIKFELLMKKAHELSADFLATGHYARREEDADGRFHLLKGVDKGKDQSYFLFTLTQEQLASVLFPLGGMTKPEVRRLAAGYGLRVAEKRESQEICFVPDNNYVRFLEEERVGASVPGNIVDSRGNILGNHDGTYRYTIGQRKGLGVAHPHPLYVLGVDAARNEVVVGEKAELACDRFMVSDVNWIEPEPPSTVEATCKIRYRHEGVACRVDPLPGARAEVHLLDPARAITPGQAAVFYQEEKVLGGGWIENFQG